MRSIPSSAPSPASPPRVDDEEGGDALRALARGLRRGHGFTLYFVVCNRVDARERWLAMLERALPELHPHRVTLAPDTTDPLAELERQAPQPRGPLFLVGLERGVDSRRDRHEALAALNSRRPEWRQRVSQPVVFWVPEFVLGYLEREAPDFFDWRTDTIRLPDLEERELERFRWTIWEPSVHGSLPEKARRARIEELRRLLAETPASADPAIQNIRTDWQLELASHLVFLGEGGDEAKRLYSQILNSGEKAAEPHARARTLAGLGRLFLQQGYPQQALTCLEDSLAIRRTLGDLPGQAPLLRSIAQIQFDQGALDHANELFQKSLAIATQAGDSTGESATLSSIGQLRFMQGDFDSAQDLFQRSLAISLKNGDRRHEASALNNLSQIQQARGDHGRAREFLEQSLAIRRELGDKKGEGVTLNNLATISHARGDYGRALEYLQHALAIQREIGDKQTESITTGNISHVYAARGELGLALEYLQQSLAIRRELGDKKGEGTTLNNLSQVYEARGDYDLAQEHLQQALGIQRELGDLAGLCPTLFNLGHVQAQKGDRKAAVGSWVEAYRIARRFGDAQALQALERLAKQFGQPGLSYWEQIAGTPES